MDVQEKLDRYITSHGIKKSHIARKTGMSSATVTRIVKGHGNVTISQLQSICKALDVPITTFIDDCK